MADVDVKNDGIITFLRNASLFVKSPGFPGWFYNPGFCSDVNSKLNKLSIATPYSEQSDMQTVFSLQKALSSSLSARNNFNYLEAVYKYSLETSLGYWVPSPYINFVEKKIEIATTEREGDLVNLNIILNDDEYMRLVTRTFYKFLRFVSEKTGAEINCEQHVDSFYCHLEGLKVRLSNSDLRMRYARPLYSFPMPEIWGNRVTTNYLIFSLCEDIFLRIKQPRPQGIAKIILDFIGVPIIEAASPREIKNILNSFINENGCQMLFSKDVLLDKDEVECDN